MMLVVILMKMKREMLRKMIVIMKILKMMEMMKYR